VSREDREVPTIRIASILGDAFGGERRSGTGRPPLYQIKRGELTTSGPKFTVAKS